jgi:hypothetical protein
LQSAIKCNGAISEKNPHPVFDYIKAYYSSWYKDRVGERAFLKVND